MRNYKTHLNKKILTFFFFLLAIFACKEEKKTNVIYVAEVGVNKLSETELEEQIGKAGSSTKYKAEFIQDWVEKELLTQVAIENGLLNDDFERIIENSKKELASSIAIQNYISRISISYSDNDLRRYFKNNSDDYSFSDDAYVLNIISFSSEESAINFRANSISEGWDNAINEIVSAEDIVENVQRKIFRQSEIQSKRILRVLKKLLNNEISLVLKTELNNFVVVQQIDKISKNSLPKFNYVKNEVQKSYIILKQRELVKSYIDSLIDNNHVKIY